MRAVLVGSVGVLLVGGCGSDDDSPGLIWFREYAKELCTNADVCCKASGQAHSISACRQFFGFLGGMSAGDAKYDAAAGKECLTLLAQQRGQCGAAEPDVCDRVLTGTKGKGAPCSTNFDCAAPPDGRAYCLWGSGEARCEHELRGQVGSPCTSSDGGVSYVCSAEDGLYCSYTDDTCRELLAVGQPCTSADRCAGDAHCPFGATDAVCTPRAAVGAPCDGPDDECVEDGYCDGATCQPKKKAGEACGSYQECLGYCEAGKCEGGGGGTFCVTDD